jgi:creatinine amidohydrolase
VAERIAEPVLVTPAPAGGLSSHHLAFPGTVHLPPEVFGGLIEAYVDALARTGVRRIGLFSAHGGNFAFLAELIPRLAGERPELTLAAYSDLNRLLQVMFDGGRKEGVEAPPTDVHAGALETSVSLHLGHQVRPFGHAVGYTVPDDGWMERLFAGGVHALSPNGVLGDASLATPEAGRAIYEGIVEDLTGWMIEALEVTRA